MITPIASRPIADCEAAACVGRDKSGNLCAWITRASGINEAAPDANSLVCPGGLTPPDALTRLALWPAWRLTREARLAIGTRVAIVASPQFAEEIAHTCRRWGALPAIVSSTEGRNGGWDAVILAASDTNLGTALGLCRPRGSLILGTLDAQLVVEFDTYPDLHRRGLRLSFIAPFETRRSMSVEWLTDLEQIGSVLLAPQREL